MTEVFDVLLLLARPAAGKSEVIDYLKKTPLAERQERFHMGELAEVDDFPMLWTWFEEDALLARMGQPRLYTDAEGYFLHQYLWDLLIERICLEVKKADRDVRPGDPARTTLVEFSRGAEHGGYRSAFAHLDPQLLGRMAILYIDVPWEESLRKNRRRFNPSRPDSILEHGLPDAKLERLYKDIDWPEVSAADPAYLSIQGQHVPYALFDNADDVTTTRGAALGERLQSVLATLWQREMKR
jgi:hypothetical protein